MTFFANLPPLWPVNCLIWDGISAFPGLLRLRVWLKPNCRKITTILNFSPRVPIEYLNLIEKSIVFLSYCRNNALPDSGIAGRRQVRWENTTALRRAEVAIQYSRALCLYGAA